MTKISSTLLILMLLFAPGRLVAQKSRPIQLDFDSSGKLITFPYSQPFKPGHYNQLLFNLHAPAVGYLHRLKDSLSARAGVMQEVLKKNLEGLKLLYDTTVFDSTIANTFLYEFKQWRDYLNKYSPADTQPPPPFKYFPILPTIAEVESSGFFIYSYDKKVKQQLILGRPLPLAPGGQWVVDGFHTEARFHLIFKNIFRQRLIKLYNAGILELPELKHLKPDEVAQWPSQLNKVHLQLDTVLGKMTREALSPQEILCNDSLISQATKVLQQFKDHELVKLLRTHQYFFLSWLWASKGQIALDPWQFTDPKKLLIKDTEKDKISAARAEEFNELYKQLGVAANTDISKIYKDTLTIRDIARQSGRGAEVFVKTDSAAQVQKNKSLMTAFQQVYNNFYTFTYPYKNADDSTSAIQEFNAAKAYKRVDHLNLPLGTKGLQRLRTADATIPDDRTPVIVIHNLDSGTRVTIIESLTPFKDQSAFQTLLADSTGIGGIGTVAALAESLSPSLAISATKLPPSAANILPSQVSKSLIQERRSDLPTRNKGKRSDTTIRIWQYIIIDGIKDSILVDRNKDVLDCKNIIQKFFSKWLNYKAKKDTLHCGDSRIEQYSRYLADGGGFCHFDSEAFPSRVESALQNFDSIFIRKSNEAMALRHQLIYADTLADYLGSAIVGQLPPDTLAIDTTIRDTGVVRSYTAYLNQAQVKNSDAFAVMTRTAKDTVPKKQAASYVRIAPRHVITLGIGAEMTFDKYPVNYVSGSGSQLSISQDVQSIRFTMGIHIYPWKLFQPDNRFFIHRSFGTSTWSRLSVYLGTALPNPLQNYYTGLGADLVPGLKLMTGAHWLWYTKYTIENEQVTNQASAPKFGGWYIGLNIDPSGLANTIIAAFK